MTVFRDSAQFYDTVGELMERAKKDPQIGPKIAAFGHRHPVPVYRPGSGDNGQCQG